MNRHTSLTTWVLAFQYHPIAKMHPLVYLVYFATFICEYFALYAVDIFVCMLFFMQNSFDTQFKIENQVRHFF